MNELAKKGLDLAKRMQDDLRKQNEYIRLLETKMKYMQALIDAQNERIKEFEKNG